MNDVQTTGVDPAGNPDLEVMHRDLIALQERLERSMEVATSIGAIEALTDQITEIAARVTSIGSVLLAQRTEEIAQHAAAVTATIPRIERELDDLEDCESMVRSVAGLLGTVDEAVRVATLVCR